MNRREGLCVGVQKQSVYLKPNSLFINPENSGPRNSITQSHLSVSRNDGDSLIFVDFIDKHYLAI